jgi:programmed cell death 6-interacting protein
MSSQLVIPFKRTTRPPIADAVRQYISKFHLETSPDDFTWDISHWESLRADATSGNVHATAVDTVLRLVSSFPHLATDVYVMAPLRI